FLRPTVRSSCALTPKSTGPEPHRTQQEPHHAHAHTHTHAHARGHTHTHTHTHAHTHTHTRTRTHTHKQREREREGNTHFVREKAQYSWSFESRAIHMIALQKFYERGNGVLCA